MATRTILAGIFVAILALLVFAGCAQQQNLSPTGSQTAAPTQPAAGQQNAAPAGTQKVKLSDTRYWNYAYLISGTAPLDAQTQHALAGFRVTRQTLPDGSQNVTLTAVNSRYHDQSAIVPPGDKLYFIEASFGDDQGTTGEYMLGDETIVMVDANGYIVQ